MSSTLSAATPVNESHSWVSPLIWGLQLWALSALLSVTLAGGLSPALRGAFVGADTWILRVDHAGQLATQAAAITTTLLIVQLGVTAVSAARSPWFGFSAALMGTVPTFLLFFAYKAPLPGVLTWISTVATGVTLTLCAGIAVSSPHLRFIVLTSGLATLAAALSTAEISGGWEELAFSIGQGLRVLFGVACLGLSLWDHFLHHKKKPWVPALLLGFSLLLGATTSAARAPDASGAVLVMGRSIDALASGGVWGGAGPFLISLAYLTVFGALFARPGSLVRLVSAWIALSTVLTPSPLVCGWLTLLGFAAVVLCWQPKNSGAGGTDRQQK